MLLPFDHRFGSLGTGRKWGNVMTKTFIALAAAATIALATTAAPKTADAQCFRCFAGAGAAAMIIGAAAGVRIQGGPRGVMTSRQYQSPYGRTASTSSRRGGKAAAVTGVATAAAIAEPVITGANESGPTASGIATTEPAQTEQTQQTSVTFVDGGV
jgi:hypothetical protein